MAADRRRRSDADRNHDRVLRAAQEVFAESGFDAPLDEIATRAGVGAGTVYRHFSTKEALFRAVVTERVSDLVADAQRRAVAPDPGAAFFEFLARLGAEGAAKRDTSDAIAVPGPLREELHDALEVLLQRAQHVGAARKDITAADLIASFKGLLGVIHEDGAPGRAGRVLAVLIDGLRTPRQ